MKQFMIVDIDGTVALRGERSPYDWDRVGEDRPNTPVIRVIKALNKSGYRIIFVSGRKERCRMHTERWIERHFGFVLPLVLMRRDDDNRPDVEVKKELFLEDIDPIFGTPALVFDDRNSVVAMWRSLGLTCLQVAEGDF